MFEIREGFDVMSYLRNPMILLMVGTFGLLGCTQVILFLTNWKKW